MPTLTVDEAKAVQSGVVRFYGRHLPFFVFSNFYRHVIVIDGKRYRTTEHYYQAQKFANGADPAAYEQVLAASTPAAAAAIGRKRTNDIRHDWEVVKEDVMRQALRAKFFPPGTPRDRLLATGSARLVEHTKNDAYWGDGGRDGKNRLGALLEEARDALNNIMDGRARE
eukprot:TRINITY_DN28567_c0_g1_i1.p1 TRINITY_DN28567_c0_g1~~TRINITY_DN28567_c0_g1_i1.p1  ORF type:complete len:191 (+),score=13.50 TRINITY_DN28567_c0_g1_i1:67-573(+)